MAKILVTGATGLLGCSLVPVLQAHGHEVLTVSSRGPSTWQADLRDAGQAQRVLQACQPEALVNLVAATSVDDCEKNPQHAFLMNVKSADNLARANQALARPAHLVHLSTDHVYDGEGPQREDQVTIRNHYAMSKLAGEHAVLAASPASTVLRVNFIGRSRCAGRVSFSDWLESALARQAPIQIFHDVWFSPLRMESLSRALAHVVARGPGDGRAGVFNLGAASAMSKAQFALGLAAALGRDAGSMTQASVAGQPQLAPRPRRMAMDSGKFTQAFGLALPTLEEELSALAGEYTP